MSPALAEVLKEKLRRVEISDRLTRLVVVDQPDRGNHTGTFYEVDSIGSDPTHDAHVRVVMASHAAVQLALAVMEAARTGVRQAAPGARVTLTQGDWDRLTLLAHEVTKIVDVPWVRVPFGPGEGSR